jgi:molecular chaperone DnaJ
MSTRERAKRHGNSGIPSASANIEPQKDLDLGTEHAFAELGLPSDATESQVKAAWRRLVSQWHPDRNESADALGKIQRINQAFEAIRRAGFVHSEAATADPEDETGSTHGEPLRPRRPISRKLKLSLEEAAAGCIKVLRGKITQQCAACSGAGHLVLGGHCRRCGGSGAISKRSFFGWPSGLTECEACLGGGIARQTCAACQGRGRTSAHSYKVNVRIPHGVRDGDLLHVAAGRARMERPPADLEIKVELLAHAFFQLDADGTIRCQVPVDGFAWIANRPVQVPTLQGPRMLALRRDRLSYRLPGEGFPVERRGARGDQVITVQPIFPDRFSTDQEILLDQLVASRAAAGGAVADDRLEAWNQAMRAWERSLAPRGGR